MKKIIYLKFSLIITLLIFNKSTFSQIDDLRVLETYLEKIDPIFSDINTSKISTGILIERSPAIADIGLYTINRDTVASCNIWDWLNIHNQLYIAHFNLAENQLKKDRIEKEQSLLRDDRSIPLGLIFYDYNKINDQAVNNRYIVIDEREQKIRDCSAQNIIPYDTITCFAAAFLTTQSLFIGKHSFYFDPDLLLSNKIKRFDELYIDFDDGNGLVQIYPGELTVYYSFSGEKNIKIKTSFKGEEYTAYTSLYIVDNHQTRNTNSPDAGPYTYVKEGIVAEYGIWYGCNNGAQQIRKPYLIVSGFDASDKNRLRSENGKINLYNVSNKNGFLDRLRDDGFDIVIYRSTNSTKSIIDNAVNLMGFIEKINEEKTTGTELIITGASMGGLIVRYALTCMEYYGLDHQTKLFISVDSPQEGASVPLGLQALVACLNSDFLGILSNIDKIKEAKEMLDAVAAKEMLIYHYLGLSGSSVYNLNERNHYLNTLNSFGNFPKRCRSVALSMGSGVGAGQGFASGATLIKKEWGSLAGILINSLIPLGPIFWEFQVWAARDHVYGKIYKENITEFVGGIFPISLADRDIFVNNTMAIDNAPGSKQAIHNLSFPEGPNLSQILNILGNVTVEPNYDCFIPSYSALGLSLSTPHTHIKNYLNNHEYVDRISNNLYMSMNDHSPSYFDFMYIEDVNDFHIYHPETKEGVFSNEMISTMTEFSSPNNLYIDNNTVIWGTSVDHNARNKIIAGNGVDDFSTEHGNVTVLSSGHLRLYAGESIHLQHGFHAVSRSKFDAIICNDLFCSVGSFHTPRGLLSENTEESDIEKMQNAEQADLKNGSTESQLFEIIKKLEEPVIFFPNPTTQLLNISSNKNGNQAYLYSVNGTLLNQFSFHRSTSLNMSNYPAGIYIIKVVQENGDIISQKIIKSNN